MKGCITIMVIKIDRTKKSVFLIALILFVSIMLEIARPILFVSIIAIYCLVEINNKQNVLSSELLSICMLSRVICIFLVIFIVFQSIVLQLNFDRFVDNASIITCVYVGVILASLGLKSIGSLKNYLYASLMFVIIFSLYYMIDVTINGLPEGRNSIFGNVSSNFVCTILYLNYPLFFYYLFGKERKKTRENNLLRRSCYIAIILSMLVIIVSGSRTTLGVVAFMVLQMVLLKQKRLKDKVRYLVLVFLGLLLSVTMYMYIPSIRELLTRALEALSGKSVLDSNVRQLIWVAGIRQFNSGSQLWGSGSSIVIQFERSAHNLIYEVLLCSGYIGIALFAVSIISILFVIMKNENYRQRFFTIMLIVSSAIVSYLQPFYSSSYTCGIMMWLSIYTIANDTGD